MQAKQAICGGVHGTLKGPGSFWVFNAQISIHSQSHDSFFSHFKHLVEHQKFIKLHIVQFEIFFDLTQFIKLLFKSS